MGSDKQNDVTNADILLYLSGLAHTRVLLNAAGLELETGVVVFVPDIAKKKQVMHLLEKFGGVRRELHGNRVPEAYNYEAVLVEYQSFYKEESLQRFMKCGSFLPIIIVGGIIPEKLSDFKNIIVLEQMSFSSENGTYKWAMYNKITDYIHQNSRKIIFYMEKYQKENEKCIPEGLEASIFQKCLMTVVMIFQKIICDVDGKILTREKLRKKLHSIYIATDISKGDGAVGEYSRKMFLKYVEAHIEIRVGRSDKVEGDLLNAIKEQREVLYDDKFYYIPEELLRIVMKPMLDIMSFVALKNELNIEGVLICDETADSFTVKKQIVTSFGEVIRSRFLRISREKFDVESSLTLIERSEQQCTSEIVKENPVTWHLTRPTSQS